LSIPHYDSTLIAWDRQGWSNKNLGTLRSLRYCQATTARQALLAKGWSLVGDAPGCADAPWVTTWATHYTSTESSNATSITIPAAGTGYNYAVDWNNDGKMDQTGLTGPVTHNFGSQGIYTIGIQGEFPGIYFFGKGDVKKLLSVDQWGGIPWLSMQNAFRNCSYLHIWAKDAPDLSRVTSLAWMFTNATSMNEPIGHWDVASIVHMDSLFYGATRFNQNLNSWNVSKVTHMNGMFAWARAFNQPLDKWDVSSVTNMQRMFSAATAFNQPIGSWNVSKVQTMQGMFNLSIAFNQNLSTWDVSNVTDMKGLFASARAFNQNINAWDVSRVKDMSDMFIYNTLYNQPLDGWNTDSVTNMEYLFYGATHFNQPIGSWNVGRVTNMSNMFGEASEFNQPIGNWNVGNVLNMSNMFWHATAFNQDLSKWKITRATSLNSMFSGASAFNQNLGTWVFGKTADFSNLLTGTNLSVNNYDQTLIGWESQGQSQKSLGWVAPLKYCKAEAARAALISRGWYIMGDELDCSVPTANPEATAFNFFPNPTSGIIYVEGFPQGFLQVFDLSGRLLQATAFNGTSVDLSSLPPGMYLLRLQANQLRASWKFVKL
jgi:surface protein